MKMIHSSIYTLLQTILSQLSHKYPNQLAAGYPIILPTFSKKQTHIRQRTKNSGYKQTLEHTAPKSKAKHKNRNIIWFNPPYNKCVASNIGRDFLNLICKHFPLAKIFNKNKNNIKVSYSCTSNISQIIKGHNKNIETIHSNTH